MKDIKLIKKISIYITDFGMLVVNETTGSHRNFDDLKEVGEYVKQLSMKKDEI